MKKLVYLLLIAGWLCWQGVAEAAALPRNVAHHRIAQGSGATVALTFDDGPQASSTPQVLQVLQQYGVQATFFYVGSQVQENTALVQQTFQEGNVIGNHSWSHPDLTTLSPEDISWQLSATSTAIQQATGSAPTLFRPPYGATNETVSSIASQLGLTQTLWTLDAHDWQRPGVDTIVSTVLTSAQNGSVILLHDGGGDRSQTIQALPQIISGLQQRGFTFTTL